MELTIITDKETKNIEVDGNVEKIIIRQGETKYEISMSDLMMIKIDDYILKKKKIIEDYYSLYLIDTKNKIYIRVAQGTLDMINKIIEEFKKMSPIDRKKMILTNILKRNGTIIVPPTLDDTFDELTIKIGKLRVIKPELIEDDMLKNIDKDIQLLTNVTREEISTITSGVIGSLVRKGVIGVKQIDKIKLYYPLPKTVRLNKNEENAYTKIFELFIEKNNKFKHFYSTFIHFH